MKKLTAKEIEAQIKRNNAKFNKATKAQKRVMIAKDVITRIESGQFEPTTGNYVYSDIFEADPDSQVQPFILSGEACEVCAAGSLMLSCTALGNKQTVHELGKDLDTISFRVPGDMKFSNGLDCFDREELFTIENCFMGWGAEEFYKRYSDERDRLLAIMRNIVTNKGNFMP